MSIGEKLDQSGGFARGFDVMRVALAFSIVAAHSIWVLGVDSGIDVTQPWWFPFYAVLPAFFALTGFLVAASAERLSLADFVINRGLRIVPALAVEIVVSAFVLGAIFTSWPLTAYFTSPRTWRYLTNVVGLMNFNLPGVFLDLPAKGIVNTSLWTISWEYAIYLIAALMIAIGATKRTYPVLLLIAAYLVGAGVAQSLRLEYGPSLHAAVLRRLFDGGGARLVAPALCGFAAYKLRYRLPYHWAAAAAAVLWCLAVALFAPLRWIPTPAMAVLTCAPLAYLTVVLGVSDMPKLPFFSRGDYSYGIYLYAFPIQQAVKEVLPGVMQPWLLTLIAFPIIALFAAFSWHAIEKPILRLRKKFSFVARVRLREDGAGVRQAPSTAAALTAGPSTAAPSTVAPSTAAPVSARPERQPAPT